MAAVAFQFTAATEPLATQVNPNGTNTSTNASQAQGAPVPQDTVTLAGQTAQGQGMNNQPNPPTFAPPGLQLAGTNATTQGTNARPQDAQQTQQQELAQLDQTLQQLGIDPQSIGLFNQLALLAFANDPAALQQFVQQLQQSTQQIVLQGFFGAQEEVSGQSGLTPTAPNQGQQTAAPVATTPLQTPSLSQVTAPGTAAPPPTQGAPGAPSFTIPAGSNQNSAPAPAATLPTNSFVSHFQELQSTVAAIEGQLGAAPTTNTTAQTSALSVTI